MTTPFPFFPSNSLLCIFETKSSPIKITPSFSFDWLTILRFLQDSKVHCLQHQLAKPLYILNIFRGGSNLNNIHASMFNSNTCDSTKHLFESSLWAFNSTQISHALTSDSQSYILESMTWCNQLPQHLCNFELWNLIWL
jgi:hypothetical protein